MTNNLNSIVEEIYQATDDISVFFYRNGQESKAYKELDSMLEKLILLFNHLSRDQSKSEVLEVANNIIYTLNDAMSSDDTIRICDLLCFDMRSFLSEISGPLHDI